jgi:NADPH:quinone reductase-like Zn-dependent oxidoreductase
MRVIEAKTFSGYDGLRQIELPKPLPAKDRVLIRLKAAGVTPLEYTCWLRESAARSATRRISSRGRRAPAR